ncbi:TRAP transporter large permease [Microbaculum marinum]|uniref:TRAP transporter large permease protein n=1 Tax=Microbaculum marinum TaxID=1764581 RepID=A0AAW9RVR0_9HYPH
MDGTTIAMLATGGMLVLLALGVPVAACLGLAGFVGLYFVGGWTFAIIQLESLPYQLTSTYSFSVLPMFLFMGNLAMNGGMAQELYTAANRLIGHFRGGLYLATIAGSASFSAISGSTVVNATVFTRISLPEMLRLGYSRSVAGASIASAGTLAAMIPPSVTMVIYGIITEQSIGALMIAGIVPGVATALGYCLLIMILVRVRPDVAPRDHERSSWSQRWKSIGETWSIVLLFAFIMGGIYGGYFSPSAAGAAGSFGAMAILAMRRRLTWSVLTRSFIDAAVTSAMLFLIVIGGLVYSRMLVLSGVITDVVDFTIALQLSPILLLLALSLVYIALGCLIDTLSMLLLTLPFVFPVIHAAGIDPIYFGVLVVVFIELGAITPPIGMNLFATVAAADGRVTIEEIIRGVWPFIVVNVILLALFIAFPVLITWLPGQMMMR